MQDGIFFIHSVYLLMAYMSEFFGTAPMIVSILLPPLKIMTVGIDRIP